jgi:hypothetical protein
MMFGENDLTGLMIDLGTAVYTKSAPHLNAAREVRIGAP